MADKKSAATTVPIDDLAKEAAKVQAQIKELNQHLNKPELDLAASVRLSVEKRELEAYLRGLLFALGETLPS
jgi:hypothetical protein